MGLHRVHDAIRFPVAPSKLSRHERVRALDLVGHGLPEVVEQGGALGRPHARSQLRRHDAREVNDLERMAQDVLPVAACGT